MNHPKLICLLGAESTGKTTLARQLAANFDCPWVPEVLRTFCDEQGRTPTREEQSEVLETQHRQVLSAQALARQNKAPFVFCDTAPLLTAVYSDFVFGDGALYARARALQPVGRPHGRPHVGACNVARRDPHDVEIEPGGRAL